MATIAKRNILLEYKTRYDDRATKKLKKDTKETSDGFKIAKANLAALFAFEAAKGAISGLAQLGQAGIQAAINFEQTEVAFTTFLGSAEAATKILKDLNEFSVSTPFEPTEVINAGQQLLAFGISSDKVVDSLRILGNASAGTGTDLQDLAFVYGQIRTQQTAYTEDLNQFASRGIPIFDLLGDQLGIAASEVKKFASTGKIGFDDIEKAFEAMSAEGGQFFGLIEKQSQTVGGRISTLVGNFGALQKAIGQRLLGSVSTAVDFFNKLTKSATEFVKVKVSEEIEEERQGLQLLVGQITDANTSQEDRNKLISTLQAQYPDFLGNLDAETASNEELGQRLQEVNDLYLARIIISKAAEEVERLQERQRNLVANQAARQISNIRALNEARDFLGDQTLTLAAAEARLAETATLSTNQRTGATIAGNEEARILDRLRTEKASLTAAEIAQANAGKDVVAATNEQNKILEELRLQYPELAALLDRQNEVTDKNTKSTKKNTISKKEAEAAEKARLRALENIIDLENALIKDDVERSIAQAEATNRRTKAAVGGTDQQIARQRELLDQLLQIEIQEIKLADLKSNADEPPELLQRLGDDPSSRRKFLADQEIAEIDRINEALQLSVREQELADEQKIRSLESVKEARKANAEAAKEIASELIEIGTTVLQNAQENAEGEIENQRSRIEKLRSIQDEAVADQLELEENRLNELVRKREAFVRAQRVLAAVEIAINEAVTLSNSIKAVSVAVAEGNVFGGILAAASIAASIASIGLSVGNAFSDIPAFFEGTERLTKSGRAPSDTDGFPIIAHGNERIMTADQNRKIGYGISNDQLVQGFQAYREFRNRPTYTANILTSNQAPNESKILAEKIDNTNKKLDELLQQNFQNKTIVRFDESGLTVMERRYTAGLLKKTRKRN